jgi:hypothetical protein
MVSSIVHPGLDEEGPTHTLTLQQVEHLFGSVGADAERSDMRAVVKREGEVADYSRWGGRRGGSCGGRGVLAQQSRSDPRPENTESRCS